MTKARRKTRRATVRARGKDAQIAEFEARDLGADIRESAAAFVVRRAPSRPTSIVLEEDLVAKLRKKGAKRGLGYQTMLKLIVREHVDDY